MALNRIRAQTDELDIPLREFRLELRECAEFGRADGGVVFWVREEDAPALADEVVEVYRCRNVISLRLRDGLYPLYLRPFVVSASKFGAVYPRRRDMVSVCWWVC